MDVDMRKIFLAGLMIILSMGLIYENSCAVKNHRPEFYWKVYGGVVNPQQWICDGDIPLAMFEQRTIEQPEENLRYFNGIPKPPQLRYLRLKPDGKPLVNGVQLYWVMKTRAMQTDILKDIRVKGQGTERLEVTFITSDYHGVALSTRVLTLTYDSEMESYIYDFKCILEFSDPEFYRGKTMNFEFSDPWYTDCPGPAIEFTGMWKKRYRKLVYESQDGTVQAIPLNHFTTSHKGNIRLKRDGLFVAVYESDGNPAFQFVGDTAEKSGIGVCWWGYDIHFSRHVTPDEYDSPIVTRFRIFDCPGKKAYELSKNAVIRPLGSNEWGGREEYPIYERKSAFNKGIRLDSVYDGPIDPFPWQRVGEGPEWDKTFGRNDKFSMKLIHKEKKFSRWQTFQGDGQGYWAEPWNPCKGYRVSCWIKTNNVEGNGATLALQYHIPNEPQHYPINTDRKLTGTGNWTRLELEMGPPPPEAGCLMIMLQLDGSGTAWFDDLEVIQIK